MDTHVRHRRTRVGDVETFSREAGAADAPVVLLPHGYPCSSCLRDLPDAEFHLLDGGHWLLETHLDEVVALMRDFLGRVHARPE